ncbi:MAG: sugar phosphate nucleotidyltransferase [Planctomycetota bacterium]|nr:sugar phosphate nucleotidyltransferase [Planctomycetota bacterium]
MTGVVTAILGGGQGTRLWPLTQHRAKPAVPVGGKFRLIDVPISNSLHAGIDQIYVLTQFNSVSLHRHISQTFRFDIFRGSFVDILAAEQGLDNRDWYQGTADAIRQNLEPLTESRPKDILVLSGDHLYLMNLTAFVDRHHDCEGDITIAVTPVPREQGPQFGIMEVDEKGRIVRFVEKPDTPEALDALTPNREALARIGIELPEGWLLASTGIYLFRTPVMREMLEGTQAVDFGKHVIPEALRTHRVYASLHRGYWRDIGTIRSFHEENLELVKPLPALNLYSSSRPIYTHPRFLPGAKINRCDVAQSVLCEGSIISDSKIRNSIIGIRAVIRPGCDVDRTVFMGGRSFGPPTDDPNEIPMGLGRNCVLKNAIVDLDAHIGEGSRLTNEAGVEHADGDGWCIRDGIIVVPRGAAIPPGTEV